MDIILLERFKKVAESEHLTKAALAWPRLIPVATERPWAPVDMGELPQSKCKKMAVPTVEIRMPRIIFSVLVRAFFFTKLPLICSIILLPYVFQIYYVIDVYPSYGPRPTKIAKQKGPSFHLIPLAKLVSN